MTSKTGIIIIAKLNDSNFAIFFFTQFTGTRKYDKSFAFTINTFLQIATYYYIVTYCLCSKLLCPIPGFRLLNHTNMKLN